MENIPIHCKLCLTIPEAAEYAAIGEQRLRKIIDDDLSLDWVLRVGTWVRIKRQPFEAWVMRQNNL